MIKELVLFYDKLIKEVLIFSVLLVAFPSFSEGGRLTEEDLNEIFSGENIKPPSFWERITRPISSFIKVNFVKITKGVLTFSALLAAFSVFYYCVIFLPSKEKARLK